MSTRSFLAPLNTEKLSSAELVVLRLAHEKKSNAEISRALNISPVTVKMHLSNCNAKYRDQQNLKLAGDGRCAPSPKPTGMVR
jgi:DNA-binding CsgD family transcriptional regulator